MGGYETNFNKCQLANTDSLIILINLPLANTDSLTILINLPPLAPPVLKTFLPFASAELSSISLFYCNCFE